MMEVFPSDVSGKATMRCFSLWRSKGGMKQHARVKHHSFRAPSLAISKIDMLAETIVAAF
jgi:hypothetical protein